MEVNQSAAIRSDPYIAVLGYPKAARVQVGCRRPHASTHNPVKPNSSSHPECTIRTGMDTVRGRVSRLIGTERGGVMPRDRANSFEGGIPHLSFGILKDIEYLIIMNPKDRLEFGKLDDTCPVVLEDSVAGDQQQPAVEGLVLA